jgi:hypothetical protein
MTSILHALGISVEGGEVCPVLMDTLNSSLFFVILIVYILPSANTVGPCLF